MTESKRAHATVRVTRAEEAYAERVFVQGDGLDDLNDSELHMLGRKFRCKRDLYVYLDQRGKCPQMRAHLLFSLVTRCVRSRHLPAAV